MTDAGVSGEGTQSAKVLPLNNAAMNSAINQRLVMCESNSRPSGFIATATPAAVCLCAVMGRKQTCPMSMWNVREGPKVDYEADALEEVNIPWDQSSSSFVIG